MRHHPARMNDPARREADFLEIQRDHFQEADAERFHWTTRAPGFAETEDELLAPILAIAQSPCLEIGCGEGNNLTRLAQTHQCVGIDRFPRKLAFASREIPHARFAAADAGQLPFRAESFRTVLIRDLLHHVPDPEGTLREAVRVLAPGGLLCLLEPNVRNPLIALQARIVPAEAGIRDSRIETVRGWLAGLPLRGVEVRTTQPLPLRRLVFHYKLGIPALGRNATFRKLFAVLERGLGSALPASRWSYLVATARRTD